MKRRATGSVAGFAALSIAAAGLAAIPTASASPTGIAVAGAAELDWGRCKDKDLRKAGAQCGTLVVPLDHDRPNGKKIRLALSRIKAGAPKDERQGPLLSAFIQSVIPSDDPSENLPTKLRATYDHVAFDPRASGDSRPLLTCGVDPWIHPQPAYNPSTDAPGPNEQAWLARTDRFVKACDRKYGEELAHYTSTDSARDVEALRVALGAPKITFYGAGYGTLVGQVYASRFPQHLRRMVLDGSFDPGKIGYGHLFEDSPGAQDGIRRYFAWVAKHHDVYRLGSTAQAVERLYYREERKLTARPEKKLGPGEWNDAFYGLAFYEKEWAEFTPLFAKWIRGNPKPLLKFLDDDTPQAEITADVTGFVAQFCSEGDWPESYDQWRKDAFAMAETAPFSAWADLWYQFPCRTWPVGNPAPVIGSAGAPPILLVAAADDRAFYRGTLELRRRFPQAVLTSVSGSLTAPAFTGNKCIDRTIVRYLRDGELPARKAGDRADSTCKAAKKPKPLKADLKAAKARD